MPLTESHKPSGKFSDKKLCIELFRQGHIPSIQTDQNFLKHIRSQRPAQTSPQLYILVENY